MRFGAWCALFALAIQFTLSFGHAHRLEISWPFGALPLSALSGHGPSAAMPDAPAIPIEPAGPAFDYCAICAVANLAGNAVPAAVPSLPVPVEIHPAQSWSAADAALAASPHRFFRARAPPFS
jgi:hypothetical protein